MKKKYIAVGTLFMGALLLTSGCGNTQQNQNDQITNIPSTNNEKITVTQPANKTETVTPDQKQPKNTQPVETKKNSFTREEIAKHNTPGDCWVSANNKVYNITDFLSKHKVPLAAYCGKIEEFAAAYTDQHGNSKDSLLNNFQIGNLQ